MSKTLARFGLKFSKDRPETFFHQHSDVRVNFEVKLNQEQFEELLKEIRDSKIPKKEIVDPIINKMAELAQLVKEAVEFSTKVKSTPPKESRDFSKEIEELLAGKTQLTFSEIQEQLNMTAPTLSSHLEKLAAQNKVQRTVMGRNVSYRLKPEPLEGHDSS